jgi:hypothetical protein
MKISVRVPDRGSAELEDLLNELGTAPSAEPFSAEVIAFADALSRQMLTHPDARRYPDMVALGFWLRRTELVRLSSEFGAGTDPRVVCVPRGLVFHVPPANVDTMFVYSWMLSLLVGNRNLVRLPGVTQPSVELLCGMIDTLLERAEFSTLQARTRMVRYGHEPEITAAISRRCDVRVIWGGDATVETIRRVPLPVHATELCFADRYSLAALSAPAYLELDGEGRAELAERFSNDVFWFDQAGCSSPRLLVWCGEPEACEQASAAFHPLLAECAGYAPETGHVLGKEVFAFRAVLDQPVVDHRRFGNVLTVLRLSTLDEFSREHCGAGLLYEYFAHGLEALHGFVGRKDQTLTAFGFGTALLREWVKAGAGQGIDRIVPVGQALWFHRFWDGHDLLRELVRHVFIEPTREPAGHRGV